MLLPFTAFLFFLVAGGTAWAGLRAGALRARGVERLTPVPGPAADLLPSSAHLWRELVSRLGSVVPASARDLPRLKRRLVRAGFRSLNAARYFQGARLVTTVVMAAGVAAALGYSAPAQYLAVRIRRRRRAIARGLPNALDLMVVCVESGLGIDQTMLQVASHDRHS